jgi:hypothetical protein
MIGFLIGGAVVLAGIAWAWVHYKKTAETVLDKTGSALDDAVNKAEDKLNK